MLEECFSLNQEDYSECDLNEAVEDSWQNAYPDANKGIDGRALAAALWRASGDLDKGLRIVSRAKKVGAK